MRTMLWCCLLLSACDGGPTASDGGQVDASHVDASHVDAGHVDAGRVDGGGETDASAPNVSPTAHFVTERGSEIASRRFDASSSSDPDGELVQWAWDFGDGSEGTGELTTHHYAAAGCYTVTLTVSDARGATGLATERLGVVTAAPVGEIVAASDPLPGSGALIPRDVATNEGTVVVSGTVSSEGWEEIEVRLHNDGEETISTQPICGGAYRVEVPIVAELAAHDLTVTARGGEREAVLAEVTDLVAGDVLLVNGQSNAVAARRGGSGSANGEQSPFIRSFGCRLYDANPTACAADTWHRAEGDRAQGPGAIGQWALEMASVLVTETEIPVAIVSGAHAGKRIEFFARNDANPGDLATNYGRLYDRMTRARLREAVRAIFFYQGESDSDRTAAHEAGFTALHADWLEDYPNVERTYVVQVRAGCVSSALSLRDAQRRFAYTLENTSVMSVTGLPAHDGCHFAYEGGYRELGDHFARLVGRDLFGVAPVPDTDAPDVMSASIEGDVITILTRGDASALTVEDGAAADFSVTALGPASPREIESVRADGTSLIVQLVPGAGTPTDIRYDGHAGPGPSVTNANGVGLLAFIQRIE